MLNAQSARWQQANFDNDRRYFTGFFVLRTCECDGSFRVRTSRHLTGVGAGVNEGFFCRCEFDGVFMNDDYRDTTNVDRQARNGLLGVMTFNYFYLRCWKAIRVLTTLCNGVGLIYVTRYLRHLRRDGDYFATTTNTSFITRRFTNTTTGCRGLSLFELYCTGRLFDDYYRLLDCLRVYFRYYFASFLFVFEGTGVI